MKEHYYEDLPSTTISTDGSALVLGQDHFRSLYATIGINNFNIAISRRLIDCYKATASRVGFFNARKPVIKGSFLDPIFRTVGFLTFSALMPVCYHRQHTLTLFLKVIHRNKANSRGNLSQYLIGSI